jgi:hypothetical protein
MGDEKRVWVFIDKTVHQTLKIWAINEGVTLKQLISNILIKEVKRAEKVWVLSKWIWAREIDCPVLFGSLQDEIWQAFEDP